MVRLIAKAIAFAGFDWTNTGDRGAHLPDIMSHVAVHNFVVERYDYAATNAGN
jgi:hypothetical protein